MRAASIQSANVNEKSPKAAFGLSNRELRAHVGM